MAMDNDMKQMGVGSIIVQSMNGVVQRGQIARDPESGLLPYERSCAQTGASSLEI